MIEQIFINDNLEFAPFDVVGIGSPLLDIFINSKNFQSEKIKKFQASAGRFIEEKDFLAFTETIDSYTTCLAAGSAVNSLLTLDALGFKTALIGQLGSDEFGIRFLDELKEYNVNTDAIQTSPAHFSRTGLCFVTLQESGEKKMQSFLGNSLNLEYTESLKMAIKKGKIIYLEGYLWNSPKGISLCKKVGQYCEKNSLTLAFNLSDPKIVEAGGSDLKYFIFQYIDILFGNVKEYSAFFEKEKFRLEEEDLSINVAIICVTKDKNGSSILSQGQLIDIPAVPTKCINSTGAGDLYVGGFLAALLKGYDLLTAGQIAGLVASKFISMPPERKKDAFGNLTKLKNLLKKQIQEEKGCQKRAVSI